MGFQKHPGIEGKVFVPDETAGTGKHTCRDCFSCQQCSDDRCRVCRSEKPPTDESAPAKRPCRCASADSAAGCR